MESEIENFLTVSASLSALPGLENAPLTLASSSSSSSSSLLSSSSIVPSEVTLPATATSEVYYTEDILSQRAVSSSSKARSTSIADMRSLDVLSSLKTMKQILHSPSSAPASYYAVHAVNNTLLIDEVAVNDKILEDFIAAAEAGTQSANTPQSSCKQSSHTSASEGVISTDIIDSSVQSMVTKLLPNMSIDIHRTMPSTRREGEGREKECEEEDETSHLPQLVKGSEMQLGSIYLPQPSYYMPSSPAASRQIHLWQLQELRLALGSDLVLCSTEDTSSEPSIMAMKTLDTTRELQYDTCLDFYLDNIMTSIPELALCLHSKGFIRGLHLCPTHKIPYLKTALDQAASIHNTSKHTRVHHSNEFPIPENEKPMFDPSLIEANALTILRFLKENCKKDSTTYLLRRSHSNNGNVAPVLFA